MSFADDDGAEKTLATAARGEDAAARQPFVVVLSGPQFGEVFELEAGREAVVGRGAGAQVRLVDEGVSRRHATITAGASGARLVDAGSANGTFVGGHRVAEATLAHGGRFQLGAHTTLKLVCAADAAVAEDERHLAEAALVEPLTGFHNRRHLAAALAAELAAARRHGRALAVVLADVDHLRRVNEAHGPAAGDAALRLVAGAIRRTVRREDVLARVRGDEFAVVARETGLTGAKALAERLRKAVARTRGAFEGAELAVTITLGVVVTSGFAQVDAARSEQDLLAEARRALARAKRNGTNTVFAAPALGT